MHTLLDHTGARLPLIGGPMYPCSNPELVAAISAAGAIGVVVLTLLYPALRTRHLIGTDIVHAVPLTLVSGLGHLGMGNTNFTLLGLLLLGSLPGIAIGSRLTGRLPDWFLRIALAAILVFAASTLYATL